MIILGDKNGSAIANSIKEKMQGKGMSHDDLKYDHEKQDDNEDQLQSSERAAHHVMEAMKANDVKKMEHALKEFIQICMKKD